MTIQDRMTGWLIPIFYYKFRELLTHSMYRYAIACPIYCLMPDHIHMLWIGIEQYSDQINAMKHLRQHLSNPLQKLGFCFQNQAHDHVLQESERQETAFLDLVEYIARNPERKNLVPLDRYRDYQYTGCLMPGYPDLKPWLSDYWTRFWRTLSFVRKHGLIREYDEELES
jgi:REP element-mobilizing transposase RayT